MTKTHFYRFLHLAINVKVILELEKLPFATSNEAISLGNIHPTAASRINVSGNRLDGCHHLINNH